MGGVGPSPEGALLPPSNYNLTEIPMIPLRTSSQGLLTLIHRLHEYGEINYYTFIIRGGEKTMRIECGQDADNL